jgi:hypothetical protein
MPKEICIRIEDDGSMKNGLEPAAEEGAEGGGSLENMPGMSKEGMGEEMGAEDDSYLTPVANEEELMVKLTELLAQAKPTDEAMQNVEGEKAFQAGFNKNRTQL